MEKKVLSLIEFLKENKYVSHAFKSDQNLHKFYYDVNGYIDGVYYNINFREDLRGSFEVRTAHTTECSVLIEWLIKEFGL